MRVLAVANVVEAAVGILGLWMSLVIAKGIHAGGHPLPPGPFYGMLCVNLLFVGMLVVSAVLLWRLRRRGLWLLAWTLAAEVVYLLVVWTAPSIALHGARPHLRLPPKALDAAVLAGNMPVGLEILSGYPLLAGVATFFAYRYLGVPAHKAGCGRGCGPSGEGVAEGRPLEQGRA